MSTMVGERFEVEDLDAAAVLEAARDNERELRRREFLKLQLAAHWADLHPATADTGVETPGGPALDVLLADESLGGDGTPAVAAFTPEAFAVAIGVSPSAAGQLIADALDLRHRHPLLWRRVAPLEVPAWQARRVARQTHRLPVAGARWVDEQISTRVHGWGPVVVDRLVAQAIATFDPEAQEKREDDAKAGWDVTLHPSRAHRLRRHLPPRGPRRHPDLEGVLRPGLRHRPPAPPRRRPRPPRRPQDQAIGLITALATGRPRRPANAKVKVYVRVDADDLDVDADRRLRLRGRRIEKLGAATLAKIRDWVGHHQVVIQPVLNMQRGDAVDVHDPPTWMRELVMLRDGHCIFPGCTLDARSCDLDHSPLRPRRPTRPNPPRQPRLPLPTTPPRQDHRTLAIHPHARRQYLWHGPHGVDVS